MKDRQEINAVVGSSLPTVSLKQKTHYCVRKSDIYTLSHVLNFSNPLAWSMICYKFLTCISKVSCYSSSSNFCSKQQILVSLFLPLSSFNCLFFTSNGVGQWIEPASFFYWPCPKHTTFTAQTSMATSFPELLWHKHFQLSWTAVTQTFAVSSWGYRKCSCVTKLGNLTLLLFPHFS